MAAAPVKSQPLHNFTLPSFLKWGGGRSHGSSSQPRHRRSPLAGESPHADCSEPESERNDPEAELCAHRIGSRGSRNRFSFSPCAATETRRRQAATEAQAEIAVEIGDGEEDSAKKRDEAEEAVQKPWNLRPRRGLTSSRAPENGESASSARSIVAALQGESQPKSLRLRETVAGEKKEKTKLWIALSREEIEEDIFVMTGSRPARRPKKRPKNVQKQLDNVFPGLWLVGASADDFRVAER